MCGRTARRRFVGSQAADGRESAGPVFSVHRRIDHVHAIRGSRRMYRAKVGLHERRALASRRPNQRRHRV